MGLVLEHEGEAYLGHKSVENSLSFGMESRKLRKSSANYNYDFLGAEEELALKSKKTGNGVYLKGDGSLIHFGGGYSIDYSKKIPEFKFNAGGDTAKLSAEAGYIRDGIEHKVASVSGQGPGASASASLGGKSFLPSANVEAHTLKPSVSLGKDDFQIDLGIGEGPSAGIGTDGVKADASTLGDKSAKLSGIGKYEHDNGKGFSKDAGLGTVSDLSDYHKSIRGRSGTETGTPKEIYASAKNRKNLIKEAESQHKTNTGLFSRFSDKTGILADRNNAMISDKSKGLIDRLDTAIDQANIHKGNLKNELSKLDPTSKEAKKISKAYDKLEKDSSDMSKLRNELESDRMDANRKLGNPDNNKVVGNRPSDQIISDAKNNARDFEDKVQNKGIGKHLSDSAVNVCDSKNELNSRMNNCDRRLDENNYHIDKLGNERDRYLDNNGMSLKQALDSNDPVVARYNDQMQSLRDENSVLRSERGECQKAYNELDKNYLPRRESEGFEAKGRELEASKIDNDNALASKNDEIASYCDKNGITKDSDGKYVTPDNKQDEGLQNLLSEKSDIEKNGESIQDQIDSNKKDLAESERYGKSSVKVSEDNGEAKVDYKSDDYKKHAEDKEDLRYKKPEQKPEEKPEQNQVHKPEEKPEQKPEQNQEHKPEEKPEQKPEQNQAQKAEEKPEQKPEQNQEQKPEDKPEQKPEQNQAQKAEEKPEQKSEQNQEQKPQQKAEMQSQPDEMPLRGEAEKNTNKSSMSHVPDKDMMGHDNTSSEMPVTNVQNNPDEQKQGTEQQDAPKQNTEKTDEPNQGTEQQDAPKQNTEKTDEPKQGTDKTDAPKQPSNENRDEMPITSADSSQDIGNSSSGMNTVNSGPETTSSKSGPDISPANSGPDIGPSNSGPNINPTNSGPDTQSGSGKNGGMGM